MSSLVIGGAGFVGLNIVEELLRLSETVVAFDKTPVPEIALKSFSELPGKLKFFQGDITRLDDISKAVRDYSIKWIYHGAAVTAGLQRERDEPELVFSVNTIGLVNTLKASKAADTVKRIINISSGSAYGNGGFGDTGWTGPLDEYGTIEDPETLYAISKYASERIARRLSSVMDLNVFNVRLSAIFGPWEYDTGLRDTLSAPMQASLLALKGCTAILSRRESRDWTYSRDVAKALNALMKHKSPSYDLYNVTSEKPWSVADWCGCLSKTFPEFDYRIAQGEEVANVNLFGERDRLVMSPDRLAKDIGYSLSGNVQNIYSDFESWMRTAPGFWR
jgi:nucleoside-diphosphate-sugar epimerase